MNIQRLYGSNGQYIGYINELSDRITAHNREGHYLGVYLKNANVTLSSSGKRVCLGNGAESLVINSQFIR